MRDILWRLAKRFMDHWATWYHILRLCDNATMKVSVSKIFAYICEYDMHFVSEYMQPIQTTIAIWWYFLWKSGRKVSEFFLGRNESFAVSMRKMPNNLSRFEKVELYWMSTLMYFTTNCNMLSSRHKYI